MKAQNRNSKDNVLFEKNLFMELLVQELISFIHSFLKIHETGLKSQLILFFSDVSSEIRGNICFQL